MFETFLVFVRRDTAAAPMRTTAQGASSPPDMLSQQRTASTTPGQVGTVVRKKCTSEMTSVTLRHMGSGSGRTPSGH